MTSEIKVYEADLADFQQDPSNANLGTERGTEMLRKSIEEVGAGRSLVADRNNLLPAGNKTQAAALALGVDKAIVVETEGDALIIHKRTDWDLTDENPNNPARRYGYHDNRTSEINLEWNPAQVALDLAAGIDLEGMFEEGEVAALLAPLGQETAEDPGAQVDRAEELQEKWQVSTGQIYEAGGHFVICDDCREPDTWACLLAAAGVEKANGVFTSPPYAEQRKKQYGGVATDKYVEWWEAVQENVRANLADDGSFFVNIKPHSLDYERSLYVFDLVLAMSRQWHWRYIEEFCWTQVGIPSDPKKMGKFKNQFEPIYQFSLGKYQFSPDAVRHKTDNAIIDDDFQPGFGKTFQGKGVNAFGRRQIGPGLAYPGNVIKAHDNVSGHEASFPVGLVDFFIRAYSAKSDMWCDPFAGSGTVAIAAHKNNRRALLIEKLEKYVSVILERLEGMGLDVRLCDG